MSDCPHCQGSHDSSGFTSGFFLGLILGGAGGYLLSSDKGKEILDNLKELGGDKLKEITDSPMISDKLKELESTMAEARAALESGSDQAREKIHQAAEQVAAATSDQPTSKKLTFFKRGRSLK